MQSDSFMYVFIICQGPRNKSAGYVPVRNQHAVCGQQKKEGDSMKIGLIGAGKMGFTLGKHFTASPVLQLVGYYSKNPESARQAAEFTDTKYYDDIRNLVEESDALFLTVPDGQIAVTAERLDRLGDVMDGKMLCHTSGAMTSRIFSGMKSHVYGYSIHPIYAVNSKTESYKHFSDCFITIEGDGKYLDFWSRVLSELGHGIKVIGADDKPKYHAAAVYVSNLVIGLYRMGIKLLTDCGFRADEAEEALKPLFWNNAENLVQTGCAGALTGPVARCDVTTVHRHLQALDGDAKRIYAMLSEELSYLAEKNAIGKLPASHAADNMTMTENEQAKQLHISYEELRRLLREH